MQVEADRDNKFYFRTCQLGRSPPLRVQPRRML